MQWTQKHSVYSAKWKLQIWFGIELRFIIKYPSDFFTPRYSRQLTPLKTSAEFAAVN